MGLDKRGILSREEAEKLFSEIHGEPLEIDRSVDFIVVGMCSDQLPKPGRALMQDIIRESCARKEGRDAAMRLKSLLGRKATLIMWPHCCTQYSEAQQELFLTAYPRSTFHFPKIDVDVRFDLGTEALGEQLGSMNIMRLKPIEIARAA